MKEASKTTKLIVAAVTVAMILLPLIHSGGSVTAVIGFLVPFVTTVAILAIIAIGLNVQWGYTGIFNFGVVGFFMVGAFVAAIVTKSPADSEFVQYVGGFGDRLAFLPFLDSREWLPFIFGVLAAALASCTAVTMEMYAERKGWNVDGLEVDCRYSPAERGSPTRFELVLRIPAHLGEEQIERLRVIAAKCPVHRTLEGEVAFDEQVELV